jgi:hypothetical protein
MELRAVFLSPDGKGVATVQIHHFDQNVGPLAPLIKVLFKTAIEDGFRQMTEDLRNYLATSAGIYTLQTKRSH